MKTSGKIVIFVSTFFLFSQLSIFNLAFAQAASPSPDVSPSPSASPKASPSPSPSSSPSPSPSNSSTGGTSSSPSPSATGGAVLGAATSLASTGHEREYLKWLFAGGVSLIIFLWIVKISRDAQD